jgi:hydrogenase nickel incorporation protein HypB
MTVRRIEVRERLMDRNDAIARDVRQRLVDAGIVTYNLVSSPGSGKTLLLERTLQRVGDELGISVITGDVQTQNDADRLARHTSRLVQAVVTGGACHLDARQVQDAVEALDLERTRLLLIENVGNLVCPASWDLGERAKIVVFSVTEGEDKPLKYPKMFREASYVVLNKIDLLPYVPFDVEKAIAFVHSVNPRLRVFRVSALTGKGLDEWFDFLRENDKQNFSRGDAKNEQKDAEVFASPQEPAVSRQ